MAAGPYKEKDLVVVLRAFLLVVRGRSGRRRTWSGLVGSIIAVFIGRFVGRFVGRLVSCIRIGFRLSLRLGRSSGRLSLVLVVLGLDLEHGPGGQTGDRPSLGRLTGAMRLPIPRCRGHRARSKQNDGTRGNQYGSKHAQSSWVRCSFAFKRRDDRPLTGRRPSAYAQVRRGTCGRRRSPHRRGCPSSRRAYAPPLRRSLPPRSRPL